MKATFNLLEYISIKPYALLNYEKQFTRFFRLNRQSLVSCFTTRIYVRYGLPT